MSGSGPCLIPKIPRSIFGADSHHVPAAAVEHCVQRHGFQGRYRCPAFPSHAGPTGRYRQGQHFHSHDPGVGQKGTFCRPTLLWKTGNPIHRPSPHSRPPCFCIGTTNPKSSISKDSKSWKAIRNPRSKSWFPVISVLWKEADAFTQPSHSIKDPTCLNRFVSST